MIQELEDVEEKVPGVFSRPVRWGIWPTDTPFPVRLQQPLSRYA